MRRLAGSFLVFAATTLVCFLAIELAFRAYSGIPILSFTDWRSARILAVELAPYVEYDPLLGWKAKDNFTSDDPSAIQTLAYGIRKNSPDDQSIRTGGALVVGDSFAIGALVKESETWPSQLEQIIGVPVINAAAGSYGLDTDVLRVEQLLPIVKPKILIVGGAQGVYLLSFTSYGWGKPYFTIDDHGELALHNNPVPEPGHNNTVSLAKRLASYSYVLDFLMTRYAPLLWFSDSDKEFNEVPTDKVRLGCALLRRLKADADSYNARSMLVMQHGADADIAAETDEQLSVARCARQLGFIVVDEHPLINDMAQKDPAVIDTLFLREHGVRGHMTAKGNRLIAELVAAAIREHEITVTGSAEVR